MAKRNQPFIVVGRLITDQGRGRSFTLKLFKYRQNAPFTVSVFIFLSISKSFQIPSECTIYCPCFKKNQEATLVLTSLLCFNTKYVYIFLSQLQISFKI